ncbi:MAG: tandem-95 repeat protein [Magnetococcales bacterium]|nr:tandem-95 repeat protein [Magnetococcales bacterium]
MNGQASELVCDQSNNDNGIIYYNDDNGLLAIAIANFDGSWNEGDEVTIDISLGSSGQDDHAYYQSSFVLDGDSLQIIEETLQLASGNDPPSIHTNAILTVNEGSTGNIISQASLQVTDLDQAPSELIFSLVASPTNGTLYNDGSELAVNDTFSQEQINNNLITYDHDGSETTFDSFSVSVTDGAGGSISETVFNISISAVNDTPSISTIDDQAINEDGSTGALSFTIYDSETDSADLTFSVSSDNTGLVQTDQIDLGGSGSSRTITVTPEANESGSATITITVSDGTDSANIAFDLVVNPINDTPTISNISDQSSDEDSTTNDISFSIHDTETASSKLVLSVSSSNTSLVQTDHIILAGSGSNRTVTINPVADQSGVATITITVSDGEDMVSESFDLTVNPINDPPTISSIDDQIIDEDSATAPIAFSVNDVDATLSDLTVSASTDDSSLVQDVHVVLGGAGSDRTVTVTPLADQNGVVTITLTVSDSIDTASESFELTVTPTNDAPFLASLNPLSISEGGSATISNDYLDVSDLEQQDASDITFTLTSAPSHGALFHADSILATNATFTQEAIDGGLITYQHDGSETTTDYFIFSVSDGVGGVLSSTQFDISVVPVNDPPSGISETLILEEDFSVSGNLEASDPENDPLTFSLVDDGLIGSVQITDPGTGAFIYTPNANANGDDLFFYQVFDGEAYSDPVPITVTINPINDAPVVAEEIPDQRVANASDFSFQISATTFQDVDDDDSLTLSATLEDGSDLPERLIFLPDNQTFTGIPAVGEDSAFSIRVTATDSGGLAVSDVFVLTLSNFVLNRSSISLMTGDTFILSVTGSDSDPSWTLTEPATGQLSPSIGSESTYTAGIMESTDLVVVTGAINDQSVEVEATITVWEPLVLETTHPLFQGMVVNGSQSLMATGGDGTYSYQTSDEEIAHIDQNGTVTALAVGLFSVTISDDLDYHGENTTNTFTTSTIEVINPLILTSADSLLLDTSDNTTSQITATGGTVEGVFIYRSSNENVVVVSESGLVTVVGPGIATITIVDATYDDIEADQSITVQVNGSLDIVANGVTISGTTQTLSGGAPLSFILSGDAGSWTVTVTDGYGNDLTGTTLSVADEIYTFTPPTTGAFAGVYTLRVSGEEDGVETVSASATIHVPFEITPSEWNILEDDDSQSVRVTGGAPGDLFVFETFDATGGLDLESLPTISESAIAEEDSENGNPAVATIFPADVEVITPFSVQATTDQAALADVEALKSITIDLNVIPVETITFIVTDAESAEAIFDAVVELTEPSSVKNELEAMEPGSSIQRTDASGEATFSNLGEGEYVFSVEGDIPGLYLGQKVVVSEGETSVAVMLSPIGANTLTYTGIVEMADDADIDIAEAEVVALVTDLDGKTMEIQGVVTPTTAGNGGTGTFELIIDMDQFVVTGFMAVAPEGVSDYKDPPEDGELELGTFTIEPLPVEINEEAFETISASFEAGDQSDTFEVDISEDAFELIETINQNIDDPDVTVDSVVVVTLPEAGETSESVDELYSTSATVEENEPIVQVFMDGDEIVSAPVVYPPLSEPASGPRTEDSGTTQPMAVGEDIGTNFELDEMETVQNVLIQLPTDAFNTEVDEIFTSVHAASADPQAPTAGLADLTGGELVEIDMVVFNENNALLSTSGSDNDSTESVLNAVNISLPLNTSALEGAGFSVETTAQAFESGQLAIWTAPSIADFEGGNDLAIVPDANYVAVTGTIEFTVSHFSAFGAGPGIAGLGAPSASVGSVESVVAMDAFDFSEDPEENFESRTFPNGFQAFQVTGLDPGGCTVVSIVAPKLTSSDHLNGVIKFGPTPEYGETPADDTDHWYAFPEWDGREDGVGWELDTSSANQTMIKLHLCEGQLGDDDLESVGGDELDGTIVDAWGGSYLQETQVAATKAESGRNCVFPNGECLVSACFIATAAHGSPDAPDVMLLRRFRDRFLLTNVVGKKFVTWYYENSPPVAGWLRGHEGLRVVVRITLLPLVGLSWVLLEGGIWVQGVLLGMPFLMLVAWLVRRRKVALNL